MGSVPKSVQQAVAPSTSNSVPVLKAPPLGPYQPMTGSQIAPKVPSTPVEGEILSSPSFGGYQTSGGPRDSGSHGAPTVPVDGYMFRQGPIDSHYMSENQGGRDPYRKINNPPTRGMFTWVKNYINGIAMSQNKTPDGFNIREPQQRTSWMRITPPALGMGYNADNQMNTPRQQPQRPNTYKFMPSTGTDAYGTGVLNSDTFGAGQTAGGIGGNNYTPQPGPPVTTSTAGNSPGTSGMPTWG